MRNYIVIKKFPIVAGMPFGAGIGSNKMYVIGHKVVRFTYTFDHALIAEKEVKRVIY